MEITLEIQERSTKIQEELNEIIGRITANGTYQDRMNVAIDYKLAELELRLEKLENKPETII